MFALKLLGDFITELTKRPIIPHRAVINAVAAVCEAERLGWGRAAWGGGDAASSLPDDMQGLSR